MVPPVTTLAPQTGRPFQGEKVRPETVGGALAPGRAGSAVRCHLPRAAHLFSRGQCSSCEPPTTTPPSACAARSALRSKPSESASGPAPAASAWGAHPGLTVPPPVSDRLFFRKHYPVSSVIFCALDPQDRK